MPAPARTATPGLSRDCIAGTGFPGRPGSDFSHLPVRSGSADPSSLRPVPLRISSPREATEREADQAAERVMLGHSVRIAPPVPAPAAGQQDERTGAPVVRRKALSDPPATTGSPPAVAAALAGPGRPLDPEARAYFEPRFGVSFADVRVHSDSAADRAARSIDATAFTLGRRIAFASGEYAPQTQIGRHLLAHELAHTVQQSGSVPIIQRQTPPARPASPVAPPSPVTASPAAPSGASASGTTPRIGIVPIREFIRHVETVERAYPNRPPQEILTLIRSLYYGATAGSPGFERLIPDAPAVGAVQVCADSEGSRCTVAVGTCRCVFAQGVAIPEAELEQAVLRLRERADENAAGDNPSPYILVGTELIDVGHLLVGIDAVLHPASGIPFSSSGMPTAPGPATWVGDVGAAMAYLAEHQANGSKSRDVVGNPTPDVESYYRNSAPMTDILGDVDAFVMAPLMRTQSLSTALRYYYLGESAGPPRSRNRWAQFCSENGLRYTRTGTTITWLPATRAYVIERITAFANLFSRRHSPLTALLRGAGNGHWGHAAEFADRFLADVASGLEQEQAASNPPASP